jgi:hypothetical protein
VIESTQDHAWKPVNAGKREKAHVRKAEEFAWAEKNLPDEHAPSVVVAMEMLEMIGGREAVTRNAVLARLEAQGKLAAQREKA